MDRGNSGTVAAGEKVEFRAEDGSPARLIVVRPETTEQELTVGPFVFADGLEDGSDRNWTLLVAITDSHFSDTRNLGDESEWVPGRPEDIRMRAASVRRIRPGIHHFKNLGPSAARLVSIEW